MEKPRQLADQASKLGVRMLQHVNQALASRDPQLVMGHVREAMQDGEELMSAIDDVKEFSVEGSAVNEKADIAGDHLREAMTQGGAALTSSEDFIKTHVQSMKTELDAVLTNLNAAALPVVK